MSDFVNRIDELLAKQNKNRNDIYNDLNIAKNLIGQWKQRNTIPAADIALKIAQYLNTTVEYLVNGTESQDSNKSEKMIEEITQVLEKYK